MDADLDSRKLAIIAYQLEQIPELMQSLRPGHLLHWHNGSTTGLTMFRTQSCVVPENDDARYIIFAKGDEHNYVEVFFKSYEGRLPGTRFLIMFSPTCKQGFVALLHVDSIASNDQLADVLRRHVYLQYAQVMLSEHPRVDRKVKLCVKLIDKCGFEDLKLSYQPIEHAVVRNIWQMVKNAENEMRPPMFISERLEREIIRELETREQEEAFSGGSDDEADELRTEIVPIRRQRQASRKVVEMVTNGLKSIGQQTD